MQRVVVIGISGGGKSLLTRQIAERFRLPYVAARLERATEIVVIDLPLWMHFWLAAERQIA